MTEHDAAKPVPEAETLTRREAIDKLGRFAAYTAPAMMVLLTSEKAMARSNENDPGHNGGQDPGSRRR